MLAAATAACSSNKDEKPAASGATSAVTTSQVADTGKFVVKYDRAMMSDLAKTGKQVTQDNKVIEELAEALGSVYKLPKDIPVVGTECGDFNAFWDPTKQSIILCYEMFGVADSYAKAQSEGRPDYYNLYFDGITRMITFHESAHMAINIYSLPSTGREEDSADQLGALLQLTEPGHGDFAGVAAAADFWFDLSDNPSALSARTFADEHSLTQVRAYNLLCWDYGAVPDKLEVLVTQPGQREQKGRLPYQRAVGCPDEYTKMRASWETLLKPYIKVELGIPASGSTSTSAHATHSTTTTPTR
ncbi:DUF4344 domain-containing metallopeptidase [Nocardia sp. CA-129566]|uniref:DUF4344 domain-containing metallopeptidase n=1 Tax=Nocardia sp. CA-129566 TaxID=3239976 RepID=UPI003D97368E